MDLFEALQEEIKENKEEYKEKHKFEAQRDKELNIEEFHDEF